MVTGNGNYEVLWPRGKRTVSEVACAPRLKSLDGKTVAELWNWLFRGDEIFPAVEEELVRRYPGVKFIDYRVIGSIHSGKERGLIDTLPEMLKKHKVDGVITTTGC